MQPRLRDGPSEAREQMHMVLHATDEDGQAIELFGDATQIRMQRVACGFVAQEWSPFLGGEDEMTVNGGKELRHRQRMMNRVGRRDGDIRRRRSPNL